MSYQSSNTNTNIENATDNSHDAVIRRKRKNLEAIFDSVPVGLLLIDKNFHIVRVNSTTRTMLNKDYLDIINKTIGQAFDCSTISLEHVECGSGKKCQTCPLGRNIRKVFSTSKPLHGFEFQVETQFNDRAVKPWFSLNIEPTEIDGQPYLAVCLNDITDKKHAEEKLVETMEIKSQFISTVSHELRTPLTAVREGLNIVLEGLAGRVKKKQKEFLSLAQRNVERLGLLINDVLDFQKLESGMMKFEFTQHDVGEVIRESADIMKLFADKHKVKLLVEMGENLGVAIFDEHRLIQVLNNLLSNAIKFTPEKGKVTLIATRQNNEITITVKDTGMGIPKKDLPKIFERFYRVQRPGKEIQGTGLGLPIVAQIISGHNGRIEVDSEIGQGTTFVITLPATHSQESLDISADNKLEKTITCQP